MDCPRLRRHAHFAEAGYQVFLGAVAFDAVAVGAEELEVFEVVGAAVGAGDDVVDLQDAEGELAAAAVAAAFLLAEEDVFVLAVGDGRVDVGATGNVGAGGDQAVVEELAHGLLQAHVDQFDGFGRDVDANPAAAQVFGGHAGGGAAAEGVQHPRRSRWTTP